jgi:cell volume regulation protein A
MTNAIIITICSLLLLAYLFDISAARTKIPSVILLLLLGWGIKQLTNLINISIPNLEPVLPLFGTVGLILIVLEGSLELDFNKSKLNLIGKSSFVALIPMLIISFALGFAFQYFGNVSFKIGLINAIPLGVISSAIAIPSARNLIKGKKEFITYESSLSDIFGVIFFNFLLFNESFGISSFGNFFVQLIVIITISILTTLGLSFLLKNLKHHVKYTPIVLLVILIYAISKNFHLPALLFILLFGLVLGNFDKFKNFAIVKKLHPEILDNEIIKFKELLVEMTFLIRSIFFLLFGFLLETAEIINLDTLVWASIITIAIFLVRWLHLKALSLPLHPLLFIAPRGLITILLFLSIPIECVFPLVNKSLIIQVVILTAFVMMYGLIKTKPDQTN